MKAKPVHPFVPILLFLTLVSVAPSISAQSTPQAPGMPTRERPALISVERPADPVLIAALRSLDMDIAYVGRHGEGIHIVADAADMALLKKAGIPFRILHEDLVAFFQSRFDRNLSRNLGLGSMGGFFTYSEVGDRLDKFRADYPGLISVKHSIGTTREGRDIWAVKVSDNPDIDENEPEAVVDSLTHAREPAGMMSALYFVDWVLTHYPSDPLAKFLVEEREMWVVPVQNPDGYVYNETTNPNGGGMWRKNRRKNNWYSYGVDPNRNWGYKWGYDNIGSSPSPSSETYRGPSSMSEPNTQAMADFIIARGAVERMSIHTYGNLWLFPWCYDTFYTNDDRLFRELAAEMAPENYDIGTPWELLYVCNGVSLDWDYGQLGIFTFSPEMGNLSDNFWPPTNRIIPIAEKNLPSLEYFFAIAGSYPKWDGMTLTELSGNGNGYAEPGETVSITASVTNRGLQDCAAPITINLSSQSSDVNILSGTAQLPALASRDAADNGAQPFVVEILPSAFHGEAVDLELELLFDGARLVDEKTLVAGVPRRLIFDDMESDRGWIAGIPGDTATSGIWERADPNGTWLSGEPIQPEDDHTPSGAACFVTGNSPPGAGPGDNDVDDGKTTLVTPLFDLSGGLLPRIGYSRWWANAPGRSGVDDTFAVEISNDGGATWSPLETVYGAHRNRWEEVSFDVASFITPTDRMRLRFVAEDAGPVYPNQSIVEAAIDDFWVECYSTKPVLSLFGDLVLNGDFLVDLAWDPGAAYQVYASFFLGTGVPLPGGTWYLDPPLYLVAAGTIPGDGTAVSTVTVPGIPSLAGATVYFQGGAVPAGGGTAMIGNVTSGVIGN